jgi:hypothetical protein
MKCLDCGTELWVANRGFEFTYRSNKFDDEQVVMDLGGISNKRKFIVTKIKKHTYYRTKNGATCPKCFRFYTNNLPKRTNNIVSNRT